jgi:hypothetical protein
VLELETEMKQQLEAKIERQRPKHDRLQASISHQIAAYHLITAQAQEQVSKLVRYELPQRPKKRPLPWKAYNKPTPAVESPTPALPGSTELKTESKPIVDCKEAVGGLRIANV